MALRAAAARIKDWYMRYERPISSLSLIGGFIFDAVTLKRVDLFIENFWVVVHLLVAAAGIIVLNLYDVENTPKDNQQKENKELFRARMHFWALLIVQFAFGGLLSTFLVFYFRSATLSASWPFLLLLVLAFIFNEAFKKHYSRLTFQISVLFLSIFSFFVYFVPVVLHQIGDSIFILSGIVSLATIFIFVYIVRRITKERFRKSKWALLSTTLFIFIAINIFYFLNFIPPLPLSLKEAGVYHSITLNTDGTYIATEEPQNIFQKYLNFTQDFHINSTQPVYIFSAVFAPTQFQTKIIHEWQYYDTQRKLWVTSSTITLPINGGRDGGYRTYSLKYGVFPGKWRVNVETPTGLYLGRINFEIVNATTSPTTQEVSL